MKQKVQLQNGTTVDANPVGFVTANESFNEYITEDGAVIRVKHVLVDVLVTTDPDEEGKRHYALRTKPVYDIQESGQF